MHLQSLSQFQWEKGFEVGNSWCLEQLFYVLITVRKELFDGMGECRRNAILCMRAVMLPSRMTSFVGQKEAFRRVSFRQQNEPALGHLE